MSMTPLCGEGIEATNGTAGFCPCGQDGATGKELEQDAERGPGRAAAFEQLDGEVEVDVVA